MGCSSLPFARPSIVVISAPSHCTARMVQDLIACPSIWTTHAPHWLVSQPTWVPVRRSCSRTNCTSSVRGSTSPDAGFPFTVIVTVAIFEPPPGPRSRGIVAFSASRGGALVWNPSHLSLRPGRGQAAWLPPCMYGRSGGRFGLERLGEIGEELVGVFLGHPVDQAPAELGDLAAD